MSHGRITSTYIHPTVVKVIGDARPGRVMGNISKAVQGENTVINFEDVLVRLADNMGMPVEEMKARPDCNLSYEELTRPKQGEQHPYTHFLGFKGRIKADLITNHYKWRAMPDSIHGKGAWVNGAIQDDRTVAVQVQDRF